MNKKIIHIIIVSIHLFAFISACAQHSMPDTVCIGTTRTYKVNDASVPSTYTWRIDSLIQSSTKNEMITTWTKTGKFLVTVQEHSAGGCDGEVQSGYVYVMDALPGIRYPTVTATANIAKQLSPRDFGNDYTYKWSPAIGLNYANIRTPVFAYNRSIDYLITITPTFGCSVVDSLRVAVVSSAPVVKSSLYVPNAFSPNGDGVNDKLMPLVIGMKEISFKVFNRWGQVVFETDQLNKGWDGKLKGVPQASAVYVWMVRAKGIDGVSYQENGTVVVVR